MDFKLLKLLTKLSLCSYLWRMAKVNKNFFICLNVFRFQTKCFYF